MEEADKTDWRSRLISSTGPNRPPKHESVQARTDAAGHQLTPMIETGKPGSQQGGSDYEQKILARVKAATPKPATEPPKP